jgi:hypothetical protein
MAFEMNYRTLDGRVVKGGMAFDSPTHPKVFVTKNGSTISKKDWKRLKRLAADDLPESLSTAHLPPSTEKGPWADEATRRAMRGDENDEERGVEALRRWLHANSGLSADVIDEACAIAAKEHGEPAEDYLPASGLRSSGGIGGRLSGARSRLGEGSASDGFEFPKENLMPVYEPPESERPLTRADRRQARDLAMDEADRLARMFGEHFASIGIGNFPRRRF